MTNLSHRSSTFVYNKKRRRITLMGLSTTATDRPTCWGMWAKCGTTVIGPQVRPLDRSYYAVYRMPSIAGAAVA